MSAILTVSGVNKSFGGLKALNDVNLQVEEGTIHAIIGPNGAGKSTFLNALIGRLIPDSGTASFLGQSLIGKAPQAINQMGVSRVFQTPEIFGELTLLENVMIPALAHADGAFKANWWTNLRDRTAVREVAERELHDVGLKDKMNVVADNLSRGDKRRLELAMCLSQDPKLLLLDEPTAGMSRADTNEIIEVLKTIHAKGMTKVIIEHDMHVVFSLASRISCMAQGHVIDEGNPDEIRNSAKVREAYLGDEADEH